MRSFQKFLNASFRKLLKCSLIDVIMELLVRVTGPCAVSLQAERQRCLLALRQRTRSELLGPQARLRRL